MGYIEKVGRHIGTRSFRRGVLWLCTGLLLAWVALFSVSVIEIHSLVESDAAHGAAIGSLYQASAGFWAVVVSGMGFILLTLGVFVLPVLLSPDEGYWSDA